MMERIRTVIWYTALFLVLYGAYLLAGNYTLAVVDENYKYMEPTIKARDLCLLRRSRATVKKLKREDLIAYHVLYRSEEKRMFGRVLGVARDVLTLRDGHLCVNGLDVGLAPESVSGVIGSDGLIIPRDTVFVSFDSSKAESIPLSQRLISFNSIYGRVVRK